MFPVQIDLGLQHKLFPAKKVVGLLLVLKILGHQEREYIFLKIKEHLYII